MAATEARSPEEPATAAGTVQRLKPNAVGLFGVIFMAVATAAPITAMTGNVPAAIAGGGVAGPSGYLVATIVLTIFSVGYVAMARHLTATGAFYGFISHGLGRIVGMSSGLLCVLAYVVFEASLVGIFSSFAHSTFADLLGIDLPWWVWAAVMIAIVGTLGYFDINIAAKVLGFFLITEILILGVGALATLVTGGGPDGILGDAFNPIALFDSAKTVNVDGAAASVGGNVGFALFFAFWSWVGFESTAMYGEESRDPKRIIPRATLVAVIGIGLLYVFFSSMAVSQVGTDATLQVGSTFDGVGLFTASLQDNLGTWAVDVFKILLVTGSFACGLAFHQCAARYLYAMGREGFIHHGLGRTHATHGSPHVASLIQTIITIAITVGFWLSNSGVDQTKDDFPYLQQYVLLAILGTMAILIVQALCSFAVIGYFHVQKRHPETAHPIRTLLCPLIGGIAQVFVVYLLLKNMKAAAGDASSVFLFKATPYIVFGTFAFGIAYALYQRSRNPRRYDLIGRVLLEETHERAAA